MTPAQLSGKQAFNALKKHLKERAHLIVIDNLETLTDIESLLPTLARLANPTKFLLTSRQALYGEPDVYHFTVPGLSQTDALQLIRQEALKRNLLYLIEADNEALVPIYETVGGNPLALRLIVGQSSMQPLDIILSDLTLARGETVENLYTYIYRRAWDNLDEVTRQAFLYMPLVSEFGADFHYLEATTGLAPSDLRRALNLLVILRLVDFRGQLGKRVYTIHNLTRTFLQEQVIKWQPQ